MDRFLVVFIRERMAGFAKIDIGEIFDAAEQYFNVKIEARAFLGSEQEQSKIVRGLYQPKTATADLMVMPPSGLLRI